MTTYHLEIAAVPAICSELIAPAFDEDSTTTGPPGGQKQAPKPRVGNHS